MKRFTRPGVAGRLAGPFGLLLAASVATSVTIAGGNVAPNSGSAQPGASTKAPEESYPCVSRPSDTRELGFSTRGIVAEVSVKAGDRVKAGDQLVRLQDEVERQSLALAKVQAGDTSSLELAQATLSFREKELALLEESMADHVGSEAGLREARFARDKASLEVRAAQSQLDGYRLAVKREEARVAEMSIKSPIGGIVLDVHKRAGESVEEGTAAITVLNPDPLWIDVNVPTRDAMALEVGQRATVEWEDVEGIAPMSGAVIFKSPASHPGARQLQVRVEIANPAGIPTGLHGKIRFEARKVSSIPVGGPVGGPVGTPVGSIAGSSAGAGAGSGSVEQPGGAAAATDAGLK